MSEIPSKPWFAPKAYGYGAYPSSWEGWATVAAYLIIVFGAALWLIVRHAGGPLPIMNVVIFILLTGALAVALTLFTRAKSSGPWRWRRRQDQP